MPIIAASCVVRSGVVTTWLNSATRPAPTRYRRARSQSEAPSRAPTRTDQQDDDRGEDPDDLGRADLRRLLEHRHRARLETRFIRSATVESCGPGRRSARSWKERSHSHPDRTGWSRSRPCIPRDLADARRLVRARDISHACTPPTCRSSSPTFASTSGALTSSSDAITTWPASPAMAVNRDRSTSAASATRYHRPEPCSSSTPPSRRSERSRPGRRPRAPRRRAGADDTTVPVDAAPLTVRGGARKADRASAADHSVLQ